MCIWMGHTVVGIPHKPAKKEALRMSRRGPPSDTPCSSLLLHSCNTPRKQKQSRENATQKKGKGDAQEKKKQQTKGTDGVTLSERHRTCKYLPKLLPLRQVPKPF